MSKRSNRSALPPLAPREPTPSSQVPPLASQPARLVPILPLIPVQALAGPQASVESSHCLPTYQAVAQVPPAPAPDLGPESGEINNLDYSFQLRSGKWIPEEEEYAQLLIALFEGGMVTDCDNGATLRSYLSLKLRCAPMRISKKFAGRGIGKMVYTCKFKHAHQRVHLQSPALKARIKATELKFLNAVDPSGAFAAAPVQFPFPPAVTLPAQPPVPQTVSTVTSASLPPPPSQAEDHTKQLHESYLRALQHKMDDESKQAANNTAMHPATMPVNGVSTNGGAIGSMSTVPLPLPPPPSIAQVKAAEVPDFLSGFEKVVQNMNPPVAAPPVLVSTPMAQPSNGDVVVSGPIAVSTPEGATSVSDLPHSPPFTSRSFDDFHRFLGTDLTLGPAAGSPEEIAPSEPNTTTDNTVSTAASLVVPDTSALFAPESYAMFAEESALATCRHAQLSNHHHHHAPIGFDVDGLLNQVQEHTFGSAMSTMASSRDAPSSRSRASYKSMPDDDEGSGETKKKDAKKMASSDSEINSVASSVPKSSFTVERFMRTNNLVSGSEPSGSSSSNSNSNHEESSSMDTAGTDDGSEEESNNYSDSSSGGEMEQPHCKKTKLGDGKTVKNGNAKSGTTRSVHLDRR